jgi:type II pantothenate kinase
VCRLHHSITTIGCTGGGAYKFSSLFQDRLDITLKKMDELECLMKGLEFVLHHVVGECYTFKPDPVQVRHNLVPHPFHE